MPFAIGVLDPVKSDGEPNVTIVDVAKTAAVSLVPLRTRKVYLGTALNEVSINGDVHLTHVSLPDPSHESSVCRSTTATATRVFIGPARMPIMTTADDILEIPAGGCVYPKNPTTLELICPTAITNRIFVGPNLI